MWLDVRIADSTALVVEPSCTESWLVFTDAACSRENSWGGIGGVLVSPQGRVIEFFEDSIPEELMHALLARSANPIFELALAPLFSPSAFGANACAGASSSVILITTGHAAA